jgi:hypothetical protein
LHEGFHGLFVEQMLIVLEFIDGGGDFGEFDGLSSVGFDDSDDVFSQKFDDLEGFSVLFDLFNE